MTNEYQTNYTSTTLWIGMGVGAAIWLAFEIRNRRNKTLPQKIAKTIAAADIPGITQNVMESLSSFIEQSAVAVKEVSRAWAEGRKLVAG